MNITENETFERIKTDYELPSDQAFTSLDLLADNNHRYLKDLRINLSNVLAYPNLTKKESFLLALAVAVNEKNAILIKSFTTLAAASGATIEEIAETHACVSLLNVNNVFYRFRHFTKKEVYTTQAGIKMSIMMNPVLGKEFFELMSLGVSAINGCELCVTSHEQSVLQHGTSETRVYEAIRLVAVVKGFTTTV
jgi:alkyl hydroperoxide reductase subunit D